MNLESISRAHNISQLALGDFNEVLNDREDGRGSSRSVEGFEIYGSVE